MGSVHDVLFINTWGIGGDPNECLVSFNKDGLVPSLIACLFVSSHRKLSVQFLGNVVKKALQRRRDQYILAKCKGL